MLYFLLMKSLDELEELLRKNFQRKFESPLYAFLKWDFQNGNFGNFDLIFCRFSKIVGEILIPPWVIFSNANFKMEILKIQCRFCLNFFMICLCLVFLYGKSFQPVRTDTRSEMHKTAQGRTTSHIDIYKQTTPKRNKGQ